MLPTFLIIGAQKAGTTALWQYVRTHPQVFMPEEKEVAYFGGAWSRGLAWYESFFADAGDAVARGEAATDYSKCHRFRVPERIKSLIPDVKLIYLLRHPLERMYSQYLYMRETGRETRPITQAFLEDLDYLHTSRYAYQLERHLECFSREQILLLRSEDLLTNRLATVQRVFEFIGVDPSFVPPNIDRPGNPTRRKDVAHPALERIRQRRLYRAIRAVTPEPLRLLYNRVTGRQLAVGALPALRDLEKRILDALRPDVERLRRYLGPDFDGWGLL
jgi:hypothetical protein